MIELEPEQLSIRTLLCLLVMVMLLMVYPTYAVYTTGRLNPVRARDLAEKLYIVHCVQFTIHCTLNLYTFPRQCRQFTNL